MSNTNIKAPEGARKLTPMEMNKLAILKAHTVITFSDKACTPSLQTQGAPQH